jgi:antitoxin (DNA-binding transcriptional repressor) of toxin-antitoxin stability system
MTRNMTATEVARNFRSVLDEIERSGESVRIERHGHVVAELGPAPALERRLKWGELLELLRQLEPADADFARDVEEAHRSINQPVRDAWAS